MSGIVGDLVEVVWRDACIRAEQSLASVEEYDPGVVNHEVGFFVGIKDGFVVLSTELCEDSEPYKYRGTMDIPVGDIIEVYRLKRQKPLWHKKGGGNGKTDNCRLRSKGATPNRGRAGH